MIALFALVLGGLVLASAAHGAGELDPTFGGDGKVVTDFGSDDQASAVAIQADGRIVLAGVDQFGQDFELARYNPDGTLDSSFDGDGKVVTDFGADRDDGAGAIAIQADGKIVAAGSVQGSVNRSNFALARYNPDGTLDSSFDGDGKVVTDFGGGEGATDVAIQADGKIVAAGVTDPPTRSRDFALARYNPDGSLDQSFDGDGRVATGFGGDRDDVAGGVAIQADSRIVAAGYSGTGANPFNFALARYDLDGSLDPTFSGDGRVRTDFGSAGDLGNDVAIQADGKIVAAGSSDAGGFALARYSTSGSLDPTFSGDGKVLTDLGGAYGVAIQADGRIVAAGASSVGANPPNFALARYNPGGNLDPTFSGDGWVVTDFGGADAARGVAIQADGKSVAAGYSDPGPLTADFALARYQVSPRCKGKEATNPGSLTGTPGDDVIVGTAGNDVINGQGGKDLICGRGGADTLSGAGGADTLIGEGGNDSLDGGSENDVLEGGPGADDMLGGTATDTATYAGRGTAVTVDIDGDADDGNAQDQSGSARDNVRVSVENLTGGTGGDTLVGSAAANVLWGGLGSDTFRALSGNDTIRARNDDLDSSFQCGDNAGDTDTVFADATPNDPVTVSPTNCEVVNKA